MTAYRTIQVDGIEVFYREGGEPGAQALLLLHGYPSSSAQYERLMERLEDRYWTDRLANEPAVRGFLQLEATRSQYLDGVPDPTSVNPDLWELDQRYLDLPGRDRVMLDLLYDYQSNVALYPHWHEYLRANQPPALLAWGRNDQFFPPDGARAYLDDLPGAELHLLDTGHFAPATPRAEIAELIAAFLDQQPSVQASRVKFAS